MALRSQLKGYSKVFKKKKTIKVQTKGKYQIRKQVRKATITINFGTNDTGRKNVRSINQSSLKWSESGGISTWRLWVGLCFNISWCSSTKIASATNTTL